MNPQDLPAVLQWLAGPGAGYVIGWIISLLAENWKGWVRVPTTLKVLLPMIVSVLVSIGATLLLKNTLFVETVGPWWSLVVGAVVTYLATQQAFIAEKKVGYGARLLPPETNKTKG